MCLSESWEDVLMIGTGELDLLYRGIDPCSLACIT